MNILFLSYGIHEYDGRQRELIKICKDLGSTTYLTRTNPGFVPSDPAHRCFSKSGRLAYISFIREAEQLFRELGNIDVIFADNRKATVPALRIKKKHPQVRIIQDARELYLKTEVSGLASKAGCYFEEKLYHQADVILCANKFRAERMQAEYHLPETPLVYENLRRLEYSPGAELTALAAPFSPLLEGEAVNIISTSGCSPARTNDRLVEALARVQTPCRLFLVGGSTPEEQAVIRDIIQKNGLHNVHILGMLNQDALKYLISQCHIGIVNYGKYDANNLYCASGKIYEFVFEGKPVVTTDNPPLVELCQEFGIGVASDRYEDALNQVIAQYDRYVQNVREAMTRMDITGNNQAVTAAIRDKLSAR